MALLNSWSLTIPHGLPIVAELLKSAKQELIFFLLMYLFVQQADSGKAPIESILPRARGMLFYQLVNDSLKVILGLAYVKQKQILRRLSASQASHSHNGYATVTAITRLNLHFLLDQPVSG